MQSDFWRTRKLPERQVHRWKSGFCHNSFFILLFPRPLRHLFGEAYQAGILSAASRGEMADVEQMKKIVPFVTCEITFGQYVCELMCGVDVPNLNPGSRFTLSKQPFQRNSVGPWYVSHCWTSAFYYHLNHGFIVLKNVEHRTK